MYAITVKADSHKNKKMEEINMKKLISFMLTAILVFSISTVALAAENTNQDMSTVTITKSYNETNEGTISPAETFNFTIEKVKVEDAAVGVTVDNMPVPTVGTVSYSTGEAGSDTKSKNITINLPEYTGVGIYTYTIRETAGITAGVTYYGDEITLVVTVIQDTNGRIRIAAVHTEEQGEAKSDEFANVYSAGSLVVSKEVTGNMGDQTKEFTVTVTFTAPEGKNVNEAISFVDGTDNKIIAVDDWTNGVATATITLKHEESVTFANIPYGVTYTVLEDDYTTSDGYDDALYTWSDEERKIIDSAEDTVAITNNKGVEVDTGITTDTIPYIMLLFAAVAGMVFMVAKKRRYAE